MAQNIDDEKVKKIIRIIIAILSALLGSYTEAATGFLSNLLY